MLMQRFVTLLGNDFILKKCLMEEGYKIYPWCQCFLTAFPLLVKVPAV